MARNKSQRLEAEDLSVLYDLAWNQIKEDREIIIAQYKALKMAFSMDSEMGEVLVKSSETLVKQTSQVLELIKMAKSQKEEDGNLSQEDMDEIRQQLENDQKSSVAAKVVVDDNIPFPSYDTSDDLDKKE